MKKNFQLIPLGNQGEWDITAKDTGLKNDHGDIIYEYTLYRDGIEIEKKTTNESWGIIDDLYAKHIQDFFRGLDLTWIERYTYEDKGLYLGMVINSQANYAHYPRRKTENKSQRTQDRERLTSRGCQW